jgi:signal transduction histidine kinase/CheY-like chemotaxis protein/HPt (histidine-containing phosphotransfer) domain-containing protein
VVQESHRPMGIHILTSRLSQIIFLAVLTLAAAGAMALNLGFVEQLRQYSFDSYNRFSPRVNGGDVAIVGVDQDSIKRFGQWPWGRDTQGRLVASIAAMKPKSITFDIGFDQRDRTAPDFEKNIPVTAKDASFANEIRKAGNVVLSFAVSEHDAVGRDPIHKAEVGISGGEPDEVSQNFFGGEHFLTSLPALTGPAAGEGNVNFIPEPDGILRRIPLMMGKYDDKMHVTDLFPAMALETVRVGMSVKKPYEIVGTPEGGIKEIRLGPYVMPTDRNGSARLYYAGHKAHNFIPAWKALTGQADAGAIKDKIVLIGISSATLGDVRSSPLDPFMQGVEIHAEMVEQILRGQFLVRPEWMPYGEAAATAAAALAVVFLAQEMNALLLAGIVAAFAAALAGGGFVAFQRLGWLVDPLCPLVVTTAVFMLAAILAALRTKIVSNEKSRFLALMSHEIRTPMTGILGIIEFLKDDGLTAEERADFINTISECSKTLLNTLNDILDVSKLEEGKLEISPVNFDFPGMLDNCVNILARMAKNKGLTLISVVDDKVPRQIHGDPHRLQQITMNLMNNALKFTSKGGVTVRAVFRDAKPLPVVRVEVVDTGIGISEKTIKRLFKGFSQADNSIARKYGGTGLGLSIAKDLVTLMGGQVGVHSKVGEGSTFWYEIPFHPPVAAAPSSEEENVEISPLDILLAEDNKVNQQVAMRLLNNKGHKVSIADDGETVVKMAKEHDFDMILMDMNMPVKSGIDAAREIRAMGGRFKDIPIIALTANVVDEYVKKCYDAGMNAHVAKPFSPKELYKTMARFAPAKAIRAAAPAPVDTGPKLNDNLEEIRKQLGPAYLNELIASSLKESARLLAAARAAHEAGDTSGLQHAAHDLKNVSGLISLNETSRLAAVIETMCRKGEVTGLPDIMVTLAREAGREIRMMEKSRTGAA